MHVYFLALQSPSLCRFSEIKAVFFFHDEKVASLHCRDVTFSPWINKSRHTSVESIYAGISAFGGIRTRPGPKSSIML